MRPLDKKGIFSYLGITFGITYLIEGVLILNGFRASGIPAFAGQLVMAAVMWVPAVATVVTIKWITREGFQLTNLRIGSLKPYLEVWLIVPVIFALIYGLTWLLGLAHPDWEFASLRNMMAQAGAPSQLPLPSGVFIAVFFFISVVFAPFMNSVFGFGEEFGWRGYLLPKLMPLGKTTAYLLLGVIWGLWHAPLVAVGFNYPGYPVLGILFMCGLTTALGIYINEMTLFYRSSILAGWIHGVFNAQGYGIWRVLFPDANPLLGGFTGIFGLAALTLLGLYKVRRLKAGIAPAAVAPQPSIASVP